jgi:hypothetical protein
MFVKQPMNLFYTKKLHYKWNNLMMNKKLLWIPFYTKKCKDSSKPLSDARCDTLINMYDQHWLLMINDFLY